MPNNRQVTSAPRFQPNRRVARPRLEALEFGDSLATVLIQGAAGMAARALDEAADEERQRLTITGEIEGVGAGRAAALAGEALPEGDVGTYHGRAFAAGARTGFVTGLNNKLVIEVDQAGRDAGEDLGAFDKQVGKIRDSFRSLPPDIAAAADASLFEKSRLARGQIEAGLARRRAEAQELTDREAARVLSEQAQRYAFAGDHSAAELAKREHDAALGTLLAAGGMSAQEAAGTRARLDAEIEEQRHLGGIERAAKSGFGIAHAYMAAVAADERAFSTPDARARVLRHMEGRATALRVADERAEAKAAKAQRTREDATFKRAIDLQAAGDLSMEWLQKNQPALSAADYAQLYRMVTEPRPARTDPGTYAELTDRAYRGEDIRADARRAYTQGRLVRETFDHLQGLVERGFDDVEKEAVSRIDAFTGASGFFADDLARQKGALAKQELRNWLEEQRAAGRKITRADAGSEADRILGAWVLVTPAEILPKPLFSTLAPDGTFDAAATILRTRNARELGQLTDKHAAEEMKRIHFFDQQERASRAAAEARAAAAKSDRR
ncbi:MAG: hypothetical protein WAS73_02890 [Defluviicoccus sp.]